MRKSCDSKIVGKHIKTVLRFTDVLVGNDVYVYGYPTSIGIKENKQFDIMKPLLRRGIVAGKNKDNKTIILDCPVYYGNSGGPVIQKKDVRVGLQVFELIGLIVEFVPFQEEWLNLKYNYTNNEISNSGYSVAIAMDYIVDLLDNWDKK